MTTIDLTQSELRSIARHLQNARGENGKSALAKVDALIERAETIACQHGKCADSTETFASLEEVHAHLKSSGTHPSYATAPGSATAQATKWWNAR